MKKKFKLPGSVKLALLLGVIFGVLVLVNPYLLNYIDKYVLMFVSMWIEDAFACATITGLIKLIFKKADEYYVAGSIQALVAIFLIVLDAGQYTFAILFYSWLIAIDVTVFLAIVLLYFINKLIAKKRSK